MQISLWPIRNDHEANFARTQHALHNALNSITQERIDEVARQESLLYELSADTPITLAISLGYELSKGRTLQEIKTEPALLKSITKSDIDTIVNTYIVDIEPYEMMLLPQKDAQCQ